MILTLAKESFSYIRDPLKSHIVTIRPIYVCFVSPLKWSPIIDTQLIRINPPSNNIGIVFYLVCNSLIPVLNKKQLFFHKWLVFEEILIFRAEICFTTYFFLTTFHHCNFRGPIKFKIEHSVEEPILPKKKKVAKWKESDRYGLMYFRGNLYR